MNREKITLLLCALLIGFCSFALVNTHHTHRLMQAMIGQTLAIEIQDDMPDEQVIRLAHEIDKLCRAWETSSPMISTYSRHDEVERVSEDMQKLRPLCDAGQYTELRLTLCRIQASLDHLLDTELPTWANIL